MSKPHHGPDGHATRWLMRPESISDGRYLYGGLFWLAIFLVVLFLLQGPLVAAIFLAGSVLGALWGLGRWGPTE